MGNPKSVAIAHRLDPLLVRTPASSGCKKLSVAPSSNPANAVTSKTDMSDMHFCNDPRSESSATPGTRTAEAISFCSRARSAAVLTRSARWSPTIAAATEPLKAAVQSTNHKNPACTPQGSKIRRTVTIETSWPSPASPRANRARSSKISCSYWCSKVNTRSSTEQRRARPATQTQKSLTSAAQKRSSNEDFLATLCHDRSCNIP
mmetsp:Transcript_69032/g.183956  ORF Transcript_69032/g.183956 Transcript_69032/m.183956 type:complete len:205 (-) Transcript_69032:341-955(-)